MPRLPQYREDVLRILKENPIHPTVDWVHSQLRRDHPKISLATVYRTLRSLVAEGVLCELPFGTSEARYGLIREERHYHFICDACRRIFDLPLVPRARLERAVIQGTGHRATRHTMEFYGRCRECAEKAAPPPARRSGASQGVREARAKSSAMRRKERTP